MDAIEAIEDLVIVGDGNDRSVLFDGQLAEQIHTIPARVEIERRCRLVSEDDPRKWTRVSPAIEPRQPTT